jgi:hypothetical protein
MGTNFSYDDTSHQVIFDSINGGARSGPLQEASRAWQQLGNDIGVTGKSYVQGAISGILTSREGVAAAAATAAISAMLPWMDDVAQIATITAQRAQSQADYWVTAQHNVPPVPLAPESTGFFDDPTEWVAERMDWFPGVTSDWEQAEKHRQDAEEQARQAMRVYQSSSNDNIDPGPVFTPPQAVDGSIGGLPLSTPHVGAATAAALAMGGGGAGAPQAHLLAAHQPAAHQPTAYQPAATVSQLAQGGHAGTAGSGAPTPGRWAGNPAPSQGVTPSALPLGTGFDDSTAGRGSARPPTVRSGAAAARVAGTRGGAGRTAGFSPRPGAGFGPRPTASVHPSIDEMSGTHAGTGSPDATRGAGYGEPFAAGASQRGEQDRERRGKYLVHGDSNAIVGDLPPTAPPVIGEDPGY